MKRKIDDNSKIQELNLILNTLCYNFTANGIVKSSNVEKAMRAVDRGQFSKHLPYKDAPQSIGYGVTISAPHMVSFTLNYK